MNQVVKTEMISQIRLTFVWFVIYHKICPYNLERISSTNTNSPILVVF